MLISGTSISTIRVPIVESFIVWILTPGALSSNLNPSFVTSSTAKFVTIFFTQPRPVKGSEHLLRV